MNIIKKTIFIFIILIGFFALAEIIARVAYYNKAPLFEIYVKGDYGDLGKNEASIWTINPSMPYAVISNFQGLRKDRDIEIPKPAGIYRILVIGDSFTFGPYLSNYDTYPESLERTLNNDFNSAKKFEVLNAGIASYDIRDEYEYFVDKGHKLESDLVILQVLANDFLFKIDRARPAAEAGFKKVLKNSVKIGLRNSAFLRSVWDLRKFVKLKKEEMAINNEREMENDKKECSEKPVLYANDISFQNNKSQYEDYLNEFQKTVKKHSSKLAVLYIPSPNVCDQFFEKNDVIEEFFSDLARKYGADFINARPRFKGENVYKVSLLPQNSHVSRYGNILIAEAIKEYFLKGKIY